MSVSTFVQGLIARAKATKLEEASTQYEQYKELLRKINAGEQPTVEELDAALSGIGKKYEDLAADAEQYSERISQRALFDTLGTHKAAFARYQAEVDELIEERSQYLTKMAERIGQAQQLLREAEYGITAAEAVAMRLVDTCNDPAIGARESELLAIRNELGPKFREARDELHEAEKSTNYYQRVIEGIEQTLRRSDDASSITSLLDGPEARRTREELRKAKDSLNAVLPRQQRAKAKFDELQRRLDSINAEMLKLAEKKLIP